MNKLGVELDEKQLIAIRKVTGSKRNGTKVLCVSFLKKYFQGVKEGKVFYFSYLRNQEVFLSTVPLSEGSVPIILRGPGNKFLLRKIDDFDLGCYYSFFYDKINEVPGFLIRKSEEREIGMSRKSVRTYQSGLVKSTYGALSIQKKDRAFLSQYDGYVVTIHMDELYATIEEAKGEDFCLPTIQLVDKSASEYRYFQKPLESGQLSLPMQFLNEARAKKMEHFEIKQKGDKMFVFSKDQVNDLTGKTFNPRESRRKKIRISATEAQAFERAQYIAGNLELSFTGLLKAIQELNKKNINLGGNDYD